MIYTVKTYRRFREVCWVWISQTKLIKVKFIAKQAPTHFRLLIAAVRLYSCDVTYYLNWRWARRTLDTHGCHMRKKKTCAFTFPSLTCPVLSQILRARQGPQEVVGYCCQIFGIYWYFSRITALQIIQKPAGYNTASNPLGNRKWRVGVFFGKSFVLFSSVCFIQIQRTSQNRR